MYQLCYGKEIANKVSDISSCNYVH